MLKPKLIYICAVFLLLQPRLHTDEPDILTIAAKYPTNIAKGDSLLDRVSEELADIPRPWTVPKFLDLFGKYSYSDVQPKGKKLRCKWRNDQLRQANLAILLAASRHPRVVPALIKAMDSHGATIMVGALNGLYEYFLPDKRFHQSPPESYAKQPDDGMNSLPMERRCVDAWWKLNKDDWPAIESKAP